MNYESVIPLKLKDASYECILREYKSYSNIFKSGDIIVFQLKDTSYTVTQGDVTTRLGSECSPLLKDGKLYVSEPRGLYSLDKGVKTVIASYPKSIANHILCSVEIVNDQVVSFTLLHNNHIVSGCSVTRLTPNLEISEDSFHSSNDFIKDYKAISFKNQLIEVVDAGGRSDFKLIGKVTGELFGKPRQFSLKCGYNYVYPIHSDNRLVYQKRSGIIYLFSLEEILEDFLNGNQPDTEQVNCLFAINVFEYDFADLISVEDGYIYLHTRTKETWLFPEETQILKIKIANSPKSAMSVQ